jgi:mRNA-degrading endonuclease toxin of MazEF toxin-antitoxin module
MTAAAAEATLVRRGGIWWVNSDPAQGSEIRITRPAIVVTANALNRVRRTVVVVPLSTGPQPARPSLSLPLPPGQIRLSFAIRCVRSTSGA